MTPLVRAEGEIRLPVAQGVAKQRQLAVVEI
jgi:hypothetical protein